MNNLKKKTEDDVIGSKDNHHHSSGHIGRRNGIMSPTAVRQLVAV